MEGQNFHRWKSRKKETKRLTNRGGKSEIAAAVKTSFVHKKKRQFEGTTSCADAKKYITSLFKSTVTVSAIFDVNGISVVNVSLSSILK